MMVVRGDGSRDGAKTIGRSDGRSDTDTDTDERRARTGNVVARSVSAGNGTRYGPEIE